MLIDSSGWIEFFADGPLAKQFAAHLHPPSHVIVPTIVLFEVYKKIKRERGEETALVAMGTMQNTRVIPLTEDLAMSAADISLNHGLAMADAIVYATALQEEVKLVTSDEDLKNLPHVIYYSKKN